MGIKSRIQRKILNKNWRKHNAHNETTVRNLFDITKVSAGRQTYGEIEALIFNSDNLLSIGNYCSIAPNVTFLLSSDHNINSVSTYPFKVKMLSYDMEGLSKGNITIDDDVWIGYGATILSGVHIGQGAVVAACTVVTKDVPPYAIVGGVPAKVIRYRFSSEVISFLLTLDYDALDKPMIQAHADELYTEIDGLELEKIKKLFAWFPKKRDASPIHESWE